MKKRQKSPAIWRVKETNAVAAREPSNPWAQAQEDRSGCKWRVHGGQESENSKWQKEHVPSPATATEAWGGGDSWMRITSPCEGTATHWARNRIAESGYRKKKLATWQMKETNAVAAGEPSHPWAH